MKNQSPRLNAKTANKNSKRPISICDGYASDYDIIFNNDKSKFIVFVSPNRRFLVKAMNSCVFYIGGNIIENVSSYVICAFGSCYYCSVG